METTKNKRRRKNTKKKHKTMNLFYIYSISIKEEKKNDLSDQSGSIGKVVILFSSAVR